MRFLLTLNSLHFFAFSLACTLILNSGCMRWDYGDEATSFDEPSPGLFIVCEGNFQYGNATLSFYNPQNNSVQNEIFFRANTMKLGDVAQSMTIFNNTGWIVVNNSHVVFAIDTDSFREIGRIENLTSPRYIHFISDHKAYISQLWDNRITIIDPSSFSVTGYITVPDMPSVTASTEQMVQWQNYVFVNCWSYQNRILKIDSETDKVVAQLTVGIQPNSLVIDKFNHIWTITDGGFEGSPYGYEAPALYCIDPDTFSILKVFTFNLGDSPSEIRINGTGDTLYWINNDIWRMDVSSSALPSVPFIPFIDTRFYGLTIDPLSDEIYVADAIDYAQQGMIYRYSHSGSLIDSFYVGVTPGAFCWKTN